MTRLVRGSVRMAMLAVLVVAHSGCASIMRTYDTAPSGLPGDDERLRELLLTGQATAALERVDADAPDDEVLRALYRGVLAYHAGHHQEAAAILDAAAVLADDRITKSVSRSALSLVSNDLVLPYEPARTERLMIPYYAAMARTRMGDTGGAAVEARRLSLLLQRYRDDGAGIDPSIAATLHVIAGAMFEANGNIADADVAFRNAVALDSTLASITTRHADGSVFVILEQGFVAHRVEQGLAVMLLPEEVHALAHGEADVKAKAAGFVAGRVLERAALSPSFDRGPRRGSTLHVPAPRHTDLPRTRTRRECTTVAATEATDSTPGTSARRECTEREESIDELPYLLKVAWPVYRSDYRPLSSPRLIGMADTTSFTISTELSRGVIADFESERALIVARTIARGAAKLALTKGVEQSIEEQNEIAGRIVGLLGNLGSALLERADTRSWHLLPAGLAVARVHLPPGEHELSIDLHGRALPLDPFDVRAGRSAVVSVRAW